jgi:hypothetical protein
MPNPFVFAHYLSGGTRSLCAPSGYQLIFGRAKEGDDAELHEGLLFANGAPTHIYPLILVCLLTPLPGGYACPYLRL